MFPQLGAPVGFIFSGGIFLLLSRWLTNDQFVAFGWRVPFLASSVLVLLGLYVRLNITETPAFEATTKLGKQANFPALAVLRQHPRQLVAGVLGSIATFVIFYLMTVFTLSWRTTALHYSRTTFLLLQLVGVLFFALAIPFSAWLAKHRRRPVMFAVTGLIAIFGALLAPLLTGGIVGVLILMIVGFALTGVSFGPLGTVLSELFPTSARYTGSSLAFSIAGILGASLAPYIATWLASRYGLSFVGYFLAASSCMAFAGLFLMREGEMAFIDLQQ